MTRWILSFLRDERGAETIELAITGVVVAGGMVAALGELSDKLNDKVGYTVRKLNSANGN
jgi:Flp pilus assembly pilin Flp